MLGMIALDIDGTVTAQTHALDPEVGEALHDLYKEGWKFIFVTGRPFHWGFETLKTLPFPYALAVQNGALLLEMPARTVIIRTYLDKDLLPKLEALCEEEQTQFVIYAGYEQEDRCFYRPGHFPPAILTYILERTNALGEIWEPLDNFTCLPVPAFSSIKFFAQEEQGARLSRWLETHLHLHAPLNRDPYNPGYYVVQGTHSQATKGAVLQRYMQIAGTKGPLIAAGDDDNDRSMLEIAHVKIVMANAPSEVLKMADIVAPPAGENGIIQGLFEAVNRIKGRR